MLVNARITKKTFLRWKLFKQFSQKLFQSFDLCIVADKETEKHLNILGAKNIKSYGNLKFSGIKTVSEKKLKPVILNKIENRKIWCAASTHPSEEIFCAKTHLVLKNIYKNVLTVIIPRHIERSKKIRDELSKLKLKVVLYSEFNLIDPQTDILIVDAYGEAIKFYNLSKCVFLGKSLIKSMASDSGQNPIEPSRLGCKILHGPFVSNFTEVYEYLASLGVTNKILTPEELSKSITKIMENNNKKDDQIIQKIENYGLTTLNNVFNEIKIYIDRKA